MRDVTITAIKMTSVVGDIVGKYGKSHVPTREIGTWRNGDDLPIFSHPEIRFAIEICHDTNFPQVSTAFADKGAELIFMPHASGGAEPAADKQARWERYVLARAYDNTVFTAICNQVGDNETGCSFQGVTFVCDPPGKLMASSSDGTAEEIATSKLESEMIEQDRHVPETFFRYFRRREIYDAWESK